jgi:hypothetical protein
MTDNISNVKTKKERLIQALKDYFNKNEDNHAESQIERLMHEIGGSYKEIEGMDWSANGKYQEGEGIFLLKFEEENFYAHIGQFRTGSYHTDFYYQDAYLQFWKLRQNIMLLKKCITLPFVIAPSASNRITRHILQDTHMPLTQ